MATQYRRRKERDVWHFCTNCSKWPTSNYIASRTKPTDGNELCNECRSKKDAGNCK